MNELTDIQTSMANAGQLMGEAAKAIREKDATIERQRGLIAELWTVLERALVGMQTPEYNELMADIHRRQLFARAEKELGE